jgi:hypothetical protein
MEGGGFAHIATTGTSDARRTRPEDSLTGSVAKFWG